MSRPRKALPPAAVDSEIPGYDAVLTGMVGLLERARRSAARAINAVMTATYWEVGRRIVEYEQGGAERAQYGSKLLGRLAVDLTRRFGRGFSKRNLELMRLFYLRWPIAQTVSAQFGPQEKSQTASDQFATPLSFKGLHSEPHVDILDQLARRFPLPWSHYIQLLKVAKPEARAFYEA
jgi:DUF1016 N-terminal domain